ncbi:MAG: DUF4126 domain-containing protein [Bryobacteraceae bacterium]|nr:DUF4126 domain-containing protein [Bryobacteraceae bacterium]
MSALEMLGIAASLSLLAGWRLYATVLAVGVALRFDWWQLPAQLTNLSVVSHTWVIAVAAVGFVCEFFADKIPWLDSLWDSVHTFIRPVGGALLAFSLISPSDPKMQVIFFLLGGGMALLSHTTKTGTRLLVNQSPEPVSNLVTSLAEDATVATGLWLTMTHPLIVAGVALVAAGLCVWVIRLAWGLLRRQVKWLAGTS